MSRHKGGHDQDCDLPPPTLTTGDWPEMQPGWVWLCGGAGPGDPGLLTLHALNAMAQADVIVHDALVSEGILALAGPPGARLIHAGKRGGKRRRNRKISR